LEQRMRRDRHRDQHVAGAPARSRHALALEPDLLTLGEPSRNLDLDLLAGRQLHATPGTLGGFRERDRHRGGDVTAMRPRCLLVLELKAAAATTASREHVLEDVLETSEAAAARTTTRALGAAGPEAERFEHALATEAAAGAGAKALEALEARLALGVDLAAIERLALFDVAHDLICGIELGEAAGCLAVVLIGVRM